jgi:4-hydroxybenzoate polyprenyltransferase
MNSPQIKIDELHPGKPSLRQRLAAYFVLVRLNRPIGILLLLWPTLWALWIAGAGNPPWEVVLIFGLGVVLMRSAGCAINDFADRHIDGRVRRTQARPLATGLVKPQEAVAVFLLLSLAAFGLVLLLDWQTVALSTVAVALAALYPFMKRYTHLPQVVLGAAFGWAVPMAFSAVTGAVPLLAWLLFAATLTWALIYDTEYAMVDREDDLEIGVKSTAILFGRHDRLIIGLLQVLMLSLLIAVGWLAGLGLFYYLALAGAAAMAARQQYLIRDRQPTGCFKAFLNNNGFGMLIFVGLVLDYLPLA